MTMLYNEGCFLIVQYKTGKWRVCPPVTKRRVKCAKLMKINLKVSQCRSIPIR